MRRSSGLLLLLAACAPGEGDTELDVLAALSEPGPHGAGYREGEVLWSDPTTGERTLPLAIWYPSAETEGPAFKYRDLFEAPGAVLEGGVAKGSFPVAVFSHGHLGFSQAASFLPVHLASHGWVVVAPDHTGNTTFDGPERDTAIYWQRPLDLSAVLDHLETLPTSDPLAGHLDGGSVLGIGHSFGGYTGFATAGAVFDLDGIDAGCAVAPDDSICADWTAERGRFEAGFTDGRFGAWVPMAAGDFDRFGTSGVSTVSLPVLTLTGGLDPGADNDEYWDALVGPGHRRAHFATATHNSFTDFSGVLDQQPGQEPIEPEEGFAAIRALVLAFGLAMRGDELGRELLDGEVPVHPDVALSFK